MHAIFTIDLEKIRELNGDEKSLAFFKYVKHVMGNKTPLILTGVKESNYWKCNLTESSIPVSRFYDVKLPADSDTNSDGSVLCFQLTDKLSKQLSDGTTFIVKDNLIEINRTGLKVKCSHDDTVDSLKDQVDTYESILQEDGNVTNLEIAKDSDILKIFKELKNSPDAAVFIDKDNVTLFRDTVLFRCKNSTNFTSQTETLFINMYLANTISYILDFATSLKLSINNAHIILEGFDAEKNLLMKSISSIFETDQDNPTDDDLNYITPVDSESTVVALKLNDFLSSLDAQKSAILDFTETKDWKTAIAKNGNGASFGFGIRTGNDSNVIVNVGEVEGTEPALDSFTGYDVILPIDLLKNLFKDNLELKIIFNDNDEKTVAFSTGDSVILSGKIF